jgi:hypothetical protein
LPKEDLFLIAYNLRLRINLIWQAEQHPSGHSNIFVVFARNAQHIRAFSFKVITAAAAAAHYLLDSYPPTSKSGVVIFAFTYSYSNERFYRQNTIKM